MKFIPNHSAILVSDATASAAFYKEALGFEISVVRRPKDTVCSVFVTTPEGEFFLQLLEMGTFSSELTGYGHFSVSVEDIHAAYEHHARIGCLAGNMMDLDYQLCYFIQDHDGYKTEIVQQK